MEKSMKIPLKTKNKATISFSNSTSGHISWTDKNSDLKRYMYPNVHNSIIHNTQDGNNPSAHQETIGLRRCGMCVCVYTHTHTTHNGILHSHKIEWNIAICSNMDGAREYHTKWSQSDRERQISHDITYMGNLKNNKNESIYETETDSDIENKLMVTKGEGGDKLGVLWD